MIGCALKTLTLWTMLFPLPQPLSGGYIVHYIDVCYLCLAHSYCLLIYDLFMFDYVKIMLFILYTGINTFKAFAFLIKYTVFCAKVVGTKKGRMLTKIFYYTLFLFIN